ncbi:MAG: hypothetical protein QOC59_150 [Microbacteriaceae bacterium]|nr:hypothetical protein [Microbacteriaceae bacterium]
MVVSELAPGRRTDAPARPPRANFRPDVQALRAVAVAGVVLYHLWPDRLVGGFVGVDVFYVISGYLITQHLIREVTATGRISLTRFWARRIRRLLPAAFTVLAVSAVLLLVLMPPVTWSENLQEIAASALYAENWLLGFHAVDYLAASDSASIVQHYWSLSVEEQFYIVWPLLLLGAVLVGKRTKRISGTTAAVIALAGVTLISLVISVVLTARSPAFAFFATPTRAWEFGLGGLVALTGLPRWLERRRALHTVAGWAGFALIAASMLLISKNLPFPGAIALLPTVGTALVLRSSPGEGRWSPLRAARLRPVQWIGDYSYSIYLWHWPLIIAAPWVLKSPVPDAGKLVLLAATLALSALSKRYIEDPIRTRRSWSLRRWPNYAFVGAAMTVTVLFTAVSLFSLQGSERAVASAYERSASTDSACFGSAALLNAGACTDPFRRPSADQIAFAASDLGPSRHCQTGPSVATLTLCEFGVTRNPSRTIVVVGNSHALRLVPALEAYGTPRGWKIVLAAKTDCQGLSSTPVGTQSAANTCPVWTASVQKWILAHSPDEVVFASHVGAQVYLAGPNADAAAVQAARRNVLDAWSTYARAGIPVLVTGDVPGTRPLSAPECIARSAAADDPCALPRSAVVRPNLMTDLAQAQPRLVRYLPLTPLFCDAQLCHSVVGGVVVYSDSHHVTDTYSRTMGPYLGSAVDEAMAR